MIKEIINLINEEIESHYDVIERRQNEQCYPADVEYHSAVIQGSEIAKEIISAVESEGVFR